MNPNMHGSAVVDGSTICTDCGARLYVGGYASYLHRNPKTGGRGECPEPEPRNQRITLTGFGWLPSRREVA